MVLEVSVEFLLRHTLNGIQFGFILFLIASGLTVILGILDVLNLAHGEFYAWGAYLGIAVFGFVVGAVLTPLLGSDPSALGGLDLLILVFVVIAAAVVAAAVLFPVGAIVESVLVRPIYERDEVYQLLLTFALLLILADARHLFWDAPTLRASAMIQRGINQIPTTELIGIRYSSYRLFVIVISAILATSLFWYFNRTKSGRIVRATAINREMATALGVSVDRTFTLVFALGGFLAGLAGAFHAPLVPATHEMGLDPLVLSFVVIVVGGLGSLRGALVGALLVGILSSWAGVYFSAWETAAPFVIMLIVLLIKPEGLFGTWGEMQ